MTRVQIDTDRARAAVAAVHGVAQAVADAADGLATQLQAVADHAWPDAKGRQWAGAMHGDIVVPLRALADVLDYVGQLVAAAAAKADAVAEDGAPLREFVPPGGALEQLTESLRLQGRRLARSASTVRWALSAADGPAPLEQTRSYGPGELAPLEDPFYQGVVEQALRRPDGTFERFANPETNPYGRLINDSATSQPYPQQLYRFLNCLDCALSALASFYGRPTVAVPVHPNRVPPGGTQAVPGEAGGLSRSGKWLGFDWDDASIYDSTHESHAAILAQLEQLGPGSSALIYSKWKPKPGADPSTAGVEAHAWCAVHPADGTGPLFWDPQMGRSGRYPNDYVQKAEWIGVIIFNPKGRPVWPAK